MRTGAASGRAAAIGAVCVLLAACGAPTATPPASGTLAPPATETAAAEPSLPVPEGLWVDVTADTIGRMGEWTNKVELADVNGDGLVDVLFANGGAYETPGPPEFSRVFLNSGSDEPYTEATESIFGTTRMLARVIKVRDVSADGNADIVVGTTYQTQSRLYLGDGAGGFTDVTDAQLPALPASIGDLEFGDVDGDLDLDMALADWGPGNPMENEGGRTMLWLNDGDGTFTDATATNMPDVLVRFSWDLELVDVDNDFDLDLAVSSKRSEGSFLFENAGDGTYTDVTDGRLPQYTNNYEFEPIDLDGDGFLELVTINDGTPSATGLRERVFLNDTRGSFTDATDELWPNASNVGYDDNGVVFLDFDSDGDADFLIGSLDGPDRLLINDGSGHLSVATAVFDAPASRGTLGMAVADLDGDARLDVAEGQGEVPGAEDERVYFGQGLEPDTAAPVIGLVEEVEVEGPIAGARVRARVHDNKSPTMPHDWTAVVLRWDDGADTGETLMSWYGEYLWWGEIAVDASGPVTYEVCAIDAAGNEACSTP